LKKLIWLFLTLILFEKSFTQKTQDTIFFKNGSMILGEVKLIKLGVISFDPEDANDITVQLIKLKTIMASGEIFRIETTDEQVYYGRLFPNKKSGYVTIITAKDTLALSIEKISILYPFKDAFLDRFSGNIGIGYSYTRSSNFGRLNFDFKAKYVTRKDEIGFSAFGIYSMSDTSFSRDQEDVNFKYNYYLNSNWFLTVFIAYQRNIELGIQSRYQQGLGAGNKFITTKHIYAWVRTGAAINQEESTEGVKTGTLTELFGQLQFNFFRFTVPKINLDIAQSFYYSLSQAGRFRNDGEMNLSWEIISDFDLNLGFYNNYDSKPPAPATVTFDFGVVFGVSYKF
jgi:hypothetical protein